MNKRKYKAIKYKEIVEAGQIIENNIIKNMDKKGNHSFASIHEILGVITEEYYELIEAIKENNHEKILEELMDVGTVAQFGIACIKSKKIDW